MSPTYAAPFRDAILVENGCAATTRKHQPTKQRVAMVGAGQMLAEKLFRRQRIQQVPESSQVPGETFFHLFLQFMAKPGAQWGSEPPFLPPTNFSWNPCRERFPQDCLAHVRFEVILDRQASREMHQSWIQKRCTALKRSAHAGAVDLHHNLFRQIRRRGRFERRKRVTK